MSQTHVQTRDESRSMRDDTLLVTGRATADEMADELGPRLAGAAQQSRGLAALAAQRLAFSRTRSGPPTRTLPPGTRTAGASSMASDEAR